MSKSNKLEYLQEKKLSPADDLREDLNRLEEVHFKAKSMNSTETLTLLGDLDQVKIKVLQDLYLP